MNTCEEMLRLCGEYQRRLFFDQLLSSGKDGEITAVNQTDNDDTILFERCDGFMLCTILHGEEYYNITGETFPVWPVEHLVREKNGELSEKYKQFLDMLVREKKSLDEFKREYAKTGGNPDELNYTELTRHHLDEMLKPGRKRINGSRTERIQVMIRSSEIPNDLQLPSILVYVLEYPPEVKAYFELEGEEAIEAWRKEHLVPTPPELGLKTTLPMLKQACYVGFTRYDFPEKEVQADKYI
jgi:hypothetical protein